MAMFRGGTPDFNEGGATLGGLMRRVRVSDPMATTQPNDGFWNEDPIAGHGSVNDLWGDAPVPNMRGQMSTPQGVDFGPSPPPGSPPAARPPDFGPGAADTSGDWKNFKFANPTEGFQTQFNAISDPMERMRFAAQNQNPTSFTYAGKQYLNNTNPNTQQLNSVTNAMRAAGIGGTGDLMGAFGAVGGDQVTDATKLGLDPTKAAFGYQPGPDFGPLPPMGTTGAGAPSQVGSMGSQVGSLGNSGNGNGGGGGNSSGQFPGFGGSDPNLGSSNYPINVNKFLDPSMNFTMGEGLRNLGSSASAQGQQFSGNTLKDILKYSQGLASTDYANAYNRAAGQQQFNYNADTGDRAFAYNAQRDDQTIPFDQQMRMAQLGLSGQQGQSSLAGVLASLLSGNTQAIGQAQGAGTIGANNSLTNAISQIISQFNQGNMLNKFGGS